MFLCLRPKNVVVDRLHGILELHSRGFVSLPCMPRSCSKAMSPYHSTKE